VWVTKWLDYSARYGVAYCTSAGTAGVFFNDNSTLLLAPNGS
jgi:hypothetical protein